MDDYLQQAIRTESVPDAHSMMTIGKVRLLHAALGMVTEAGEFADAMKKVLFYSKPIDIVNLREELGDILWYVAIAMDVLGTDFTTEMQRNIAKLRTRYPDKFSNENANTRDLDAEREVLETGYKPGEYEEGLKNVMRDMYP